MKKVVMLLVVCLCAFAFAKVVTGRTDVNVAERAVAEDSRVQETTKLEFYPTISYQGLLKDSEGKLIADGSYSLTFSVYDAEDSEEKIWKEVQTVEIKNGIVNCYVGAVEKLNLPFDKQYWLSVSIGDEELPRMIMGGTPYSLHARRIAEDAIVAGKNISVTKAEDGKLIVSNMTIAKNDSGFIWNLEDNGSGIRMDDCDSLSLGTCGVAFGSRSVASGAYSTATGKLTKATGSWSTAMGYNSKASHSYSMALGCNTQALGWKSFAFGNANTINSGSAQSYLFGEGNTTNGSGYEFGFGLNLTTYGNTTFAIGKNFTNLKSNSCVIGFNRPNLFVGEYKVCVGMSAAEIDSLYAHTTTHPTSGKEFLVNGTIYTKALRLKTEVWADYVFKKDYTLKPLSEVEKHINENGHLPGIISEKEALAEDIDVGNIQVKLLEKIEELTLYMIDQDKKINGQEAVIKELQAKIK